MWLKNLSILRQKKFMNNLLLSKFHSNTIRLVLYQMQLLLKEGSMVAICRFRRQYIFIWWKTIIVFKMSQIIKHKHSIATSALSTYSSNIEDSTLIALTRINGLCENIRLFFVLVWLITDNFTNLLLFSTVYGIINGVFIVFAIDLIGILGDGLVKIYLRLLKQKDSIEKKFILNKWKTIFNIWSLLSMMKNTEKNRYSAKKSITMASKQTRKATTTSNKSNKMAIKTILTLIKQSFVFVDQVSMILSIYDYFSAVWYVIFLCVCNRVCRERNGFFVACSEESVDIFCDPDVTTGALCIFKCFVLFCLCFC